MNNIAIYAGTFDPITYGHVDLIERATRIFNRVIVAIAINKYKQPLFTLNERVEMTTEVLKKYENVQVVGFDSLLLDLAKEYKANVLLRGLRTVTDFDYEFQLASMNRYLDQHVETMFLMPAERYMYISSSLVREIASLGGDVKGFVPPQTVAALEKKFRK